MMGETLTLFLYVIELNSWLTCQNGRPYSRTCLTPLDVVLGSFIIEFMSKYKSIKILVPPS